jgi:hypothetical protein
LNFTERKPGDVLPFIGGANFEIRLETGPEF